MLKVHALGDENQPSFKSSWPNNIYSGLHLLKRNSSKFDPSIAGNTYTYIENSSWRYCSKIVLTTVVTEAQD